MQELLWSGDTAVFEPAFLQPSFGIAVKHCLLHLEVCKSRSTLPPNRLMGMLRFAHPGWRLSGNSEKHHEHW